MVAGERGHRGAHVLAWADTPDDDLLRLHEAVWRTLRDAPGSGWLNPLHDPARWTPHITLARARDAVRPEADAAVFSEASGGPAGVLTGRWVRARTYDSAARTVDHLGP
ncbi:hypothetical protein [Streptomyces sp. NPDC006285]|uniref:hypothetical protein n=1 Tax=Streptomyces sp. NPDC006285 TaxID=3364742 RepID=UPI003679DF58